MRFLDSIKSFIHVGRWPVGIFHSLIFMFLYFLRSSGRLPSCYQHCNDLRVVWYNYECVGNKVFTFHFSFYGTVFMFLHHHCILLFYKTFFSFILLLAYYTMADKHREYIWILPLPQCSIHPHSTKRTPT